jgi:hypothetical protein
MNAVLSDTKRQVRLTAILALAAAMVLAISPRPVDAASGSGTWAGTTRARCGTFTTDHSRCGAVQDITLNLAQTGGKISGSYTCAYGNLNCRGMQEKGSIERGSLKGNQLEFVVMAPDRSTCRFTGLLKEDSGKGTYSCKGGSQLDERGTWRVKRKE